MPNHNVKYMFLTPVIAFNILDIARKLKPKTRYGADGISTKLLKKTTDKIVDPITYIINLTFNKGTLPTDLKCTKVISIHKAGDPCLLNNYRPIVIFQNTGENNVQQNSTIHSVLRLLNHCADVSNSNPT